MHQPESSEPIQKIERPVVSKQSSWPGVRSWSLHLLLFVATLFTSTAFGSALVESFARKRPLNPNGLIDCYVRLAHFDRVIWTGLSFSLPLLTILLAHELGHYLECRRRHVGATLPYFLPSPSLFGTFGAFIRIRSPIYSREGLFDIGIGGPLAGFLTLIPFLIIGVALSQVTPGSFPTDSILFATPLALRIAEVFRFPGLPPAQILLHPMAMAAWAGLFATALNLLPIGQLDGGHILYAIGSEHWHRRIGIAFVVALMLSGFLYWPWWIWGLVMFFFGRRHPLIYDNTRLSPGRLVLSVAVLLIFILSVTIVPVRSI